MPLLASISAGGIFIPAMRGRPSSTPLLVTSAAAVGQGEATLGGSDSKVNIEAMFSDFTVKTLASICVLRIDSVCFYALFYVQTLCRRNIALRCIIRKDLVFVCD